jgi:hypothetical protein
MASQLLPLGVYAEGPPEKPLADSFTRADRQVCWIQDLGRYEGR